MEGAPLSVRDCIICKTICIVYTQGFLPAPRRHVPMALANQLCRVTVVAPNTRMDIALPDHVRLCDLQGDLLAHAAEGPGGDDLLDSGADAGGWVLTRLGGAPLDPQLTPRQHDLVDGEELYLVPITDPGPQAVFDDIIDAMATANQ